MGRISIEMGNLPLLYLYPAVYRYEDGRMGSRAVSCGRRSKGGQTPKMGPRTPMMRIGKNGGAIRPISMFHGRRCKRCGTCIVAERNDPKALKEITPAYGIKNKVGDRIARRTCVTNQLRINNSISREWNKLTWRKFSTKCEVRARYKNPYAF